MNSRFKTYIPQEGSDTVGQSLSDEKSGCLMDSGEGTISRVILAKNDSRMIYDNDSKSQANFGRSNKIVRTPPGTIIKPSKLSIENGSKHKTPEKMEHEYASLETPENDSTNTPNKSLVCKNKTKLKPTTNKQNKNIKALNWQNDETPKPKRKVAEISPKNQATAKRPKSKTTFTVPTSNQFDELEQDNINNVEETERPAKAEPIFVTGVLNINVLKETLGSITNNQTYSMTTLRNGHTVKIVPTTIETYKLIRSNFTENNISHYTYQLKSERAYRVVLRGLHHSENIEDIEDELTKMGHEARHIVNVLHRKTKEKLPLFYIDLEPKPNNKEIFNVKYLNHMKVSFEAPYKKKDIIQCKRCQRFGHTKNQCMRPYRCVKCGNDHPTASCQKQSNTDATCANCEGKHPASYKGCQKYQQYRQNILKLKPKEPNKQNVLVKSPKEFVPITSQLNRNQTPKSTYAEVVKRNHQTNLNQNRNSESNDITTIIDNMFNKLQHFMCNMIDNMMDRMIQLFTQITQK